MVKSTAVQYFWRGDQNNWIAYDKDVCNALEPHFNKSTAKARVDKERYIDFSMDHADVIKNFNKGSLDDEENVIAIQKRYDDENRRRAIRRVVPEFFGKEKFLILDGFTKKAKEDLIGDVELYGGLVSGKYSNAITFVIYNPKDKKNWEANSEILYKAQDAKTPIVDADFIESCIGEAKVVDSKDYIIELPAKPAPVVPVAAPAPAPAAAAAAPVVADKVVDKAAAAAKRKQEEEDAANGQPAAKVAKKADDLQYLQIPILPPALKDCPSIVVGTEWMGKCVMEGTSDAYPVIFKVLERNGSDFSGEIQWLTLNTRTKFRGTLKGTDIEFEEYEIISGEDVEVPMKYSATLVDNIKMTGRSEPEHEPGEEETSECEFTLERNILKPSKDFDNFKVGAEFDGALYTVKKFKIQVTGRKGASVDGTITWEDGTSNAIKGKLEGDSIKWQEGANVFDGSLTGNQRVGGNHSQGLFEMGLSK